MGFYSFYSETKLLNIGSTIILVLLLCNGLMISYSFNIDQVYPILITDKYDHPKSQFGASVVLLEKSSDSNSNLGNALGWILIGAPVANSSHPNQLKINEPGVIWRCSLGRNRTEDNDCRVVLVDPTAEFDPKDRKNAHSDWKNCSGLGQTMWIGKSDRFVACANRWINQKYKSSDIQKIQMHYMNGICYWFPKEYLQIEQGNWSWISSGNSYQHRLLPILRWGRQQRGSKGRPLNKGTQDWAVGQVGFSLHLTDKNELLLGAPGINDWTGAVIEYNDDPSTNTVRNTHNINHSRFNAEGAKEFSQVWVSQALNIQGWKDVPLKPVESSHLGHGNGECSESNFRNDTSMGTFYDYFGYAVTSGHYLRPSCMDSNATQYAAGSPGADFRKGKVLIFTLEKPKEAFEAEIRVKKELSIEDEYIYGSYFGSVLSSSDLNNNGFDDVIVGAPLYSISDPNLVTSGDEGCIFIYYSDGTQFSEPPFKICGNATGGRFGTAISSLGDINYDDINDLAVGAPYENDGVGAVYIYSGTSSNYLRLTQKLTPQRIQDSIRGFGYSLSLGVDIDDNGFPDLAVGCHKSNQVVVYRTIPVVNATGEIRTNVWKLWADVTEFQIQSCISFHGILLPTFLALNFTVTLVLDTQIRSKRMTEWTSIQLQASSLNPKVDLSKNTLNYEATFHTNGTCYSFTAIKLLNAGSSVSSIRLTQRFQLVQEKSDKTPRVINYEIIRNNNGEPLLQLNNSDSEFKKFNEIQPLTITKAIYVSKELPISQKCIGSQTNQHENYNCRARLVLSAIFRNASGYIFGPNNTNPFVTGSSDKLKLEVTVHNVGEMAHSPMFVKVSWNSTFTTSYPPSHCQPLFLNVRNPYEKTRFECKLEVGKERSLPSNTKEVVSIDFNMKNMYPVEGENALHFSFTANTSSDVEKEPSFTYSLPMRDQSKIVVHDSPKPKETEYFFNTTSNKISFQHEYGVSLSGPSSVYNLQIQFRVPVSVVINGRPIKVIQVDKVEGRIGVTLLQCKQSLPNSSLMSDSTHDIYSRRSNEKENYWQQMINNESKASTWKSRVSKQANENESSVRKWRSSKLRKNRGLNQVSISCAKSSVECSVLHCDSIDSFNQKDYANFHIHMRLHIGNLIESMLMSVETDMHGTISDYFGNRIGSESYGSVVTVLRIDSQSPEIPAWLIIVSLSTGLSILTIIIFCLTKCGFFERENLQQRKQHKKM